MKSDTHKKLQEIVKGYYAEKGWIAIIEQCIKGKKIDVLVQEIKSKHTIANEIQLSPKHSLENIQLDLKVGCDEVRIIAENNAVLVKIKEEILRRLEKELFEKVKFQIIEEFIPSKKQQNKKNKAEFNMEDNTEDNMEKNREEKGVMPREDFVKRIINRWQP